MKHLAITEESMMDYLNNLRQLDIQQGIQTSIRNQRFLSQANSSAMLPVFDHQWVSCFLNQHPEFKTVLSHYIEVQGVSNITWERVNKWFNEFTSMLESKNILLENM